MFCVWDQRAQEKCASPYFGSLIVPPGADDSHVVHGADIAELTANIRQRLDGFRPRITIELAAEFDSTLQATIKRFNAMAREGRDHDFQRGAAAFDNFAAGLPREEGQVSSAMWPISDQGPYYAALIVAGALDTKGGPKTDIDGRLVDHDDKPIPGLYGVGNCVAAGSAGAYWAGGGTLGPILAFAHRTANAIVRDTRISSEHDFISEGAPGDVDA